MTTFIVSKHEEFRIRDDQTSGNEELERYLKKRWHFYKGLSQLIIATLIGIAFGYQIALIFVTIFTIYQDACINVRALGKPFDYQGETAWLDIHLRKLFKNNRNIFIFKVICLTAAICNLLF